MISIRNLSKWFGAKQVLDDCTLAVAKGERYGLIRFGSRTDVYLPAGAAEAAVDPGETVRAGATVIARWR